VEFHSEEKMTAARKVRFELLADNYLSEDPDYKPRIELVCTNGKYSYADFNPGIRLGPPNRPGFWGQPQMEVMVRVDGAHSYHGWNWIRDRFLSMDKGTTRALIGATSSRWKSVAEEVQRSPNSHQLALISPGLRTPVI